MSPAPIRIAILTCDTPIDAVQSVHGDYYAIYSTFLARSLPHGVSKDRYVIHSYDVVKMEYPADNEDYDALWLTGSGESDCGTKVASVN